MAISPPPALTFIPPLFSSEAKSRLASLVHEARRIAINFPQILDLIDRDRDRIALEKKKMRVKDAIWRQSHNVPLFGDRNLDADDDEEICLYRGRERIPAAVVLTFLFVRGWLGGFKGQITAAMLAESKTLEHILASQGLTSIG